MSWLKAKSRLLFNTEVDGEVLFFIALSISLLSSFIINTTFMPHLHVKYLNRVNYLAFALLAIKIYIFDDNKFVNNLMVTMAIIIGFISWRKTNNNIVMIMIAFIMGAKGIDFYKIVRTYFNINLVLLLLTITYALLGIIRNFIFYRNGFYRLSMGIDYPTDFAAYVFYLILAYCYLHFEKLNLGDWTAFVVISALLYLITNARLDAILILLIIPVIAGARKIQFEDKLNNEVNGLSYIVNHYWSLTIILPYIYVLMTAYYNNHNKILSKINDVLSGRLWYGKLGLQRYGISVLGQRVTEHGWGGLKGYNLSQTDIAKYFFIDSTYIRLIVIYGVLTGAILIGVLFFVSIRETIRGNYALVSILLLIAISSLVDQHMLEITYNVFLLSLLSNDKNKQVGGI